MITDNQGHKENDSYILTDPALHLVPDAGFYPILDEMRHSLDANRRKDGVKEFASTHICGNLCTSLRLNA